VRRSLRNSTQSSCTSNLSRSWSNSWNNLCSNSCNTQWADPGKPSAFVFASFYGIDIMYKYSHCLQKVVFAIGNHYTLNIKSISFIIHRFTANVFAHCPSHFNHTVQQTGNYTLDDLTNMYMKYKHKRPKHILLYLAYSKSQCFFFV